MYILITESLRGLSFNFIHGRFSSECAADVVEPKYYTLIPEEGLATVAPDTLRTSRTKQDNARMHIVKCTFSWLENNDAQTLK